MDNKLNITGSITEESLTSFTEKAMTEYGIEVVEQRAVPDFRDGLKPVHRAILWSMYELGLWYNKGYKKSARVVGEVLGCFTGNTRVLLADRTTATFEELTEKYPYQKFKVLSLNENGKLVEADAYAPRITKYVDTIFAVLLRNITKNTSSLVFCTPEHNFLSQNGEYIPISEFKNKDFLFQLNGEDSFIVLDINDIFLDKREIPVYDLTVDKYHNFLVCPGNTDNNGIVVHNSYHPHSDCLHGNTKIPLLSGEITTIKELADRSAGKKWILSYDKDNKYFVPALAHSWRVGQTTEKIYRITLINDETIECTSNHLFFIKNQGWIKAEDLINGMELLGGNLLREDFNPITPAYWLYRIKSIEIIQQNHAENMYDFTVDKYHNMVVYTSNGDKTGNCIVAHNSACYNAMVGLANTPVHVIDGYGNWGTHTDDAASLRYCFVAGTKITTEHGLIPIEEIPLYSNCIYDHEKALKTQGYRVDLDLQVASDKNNETASHWINSGLQDVVKVATSAGYETICTPNQPFLILNDDLEYEWVEARHLTKYDKICMKRKEITNLPSHGELPEHIFERKAGNKKEYILPTHMSEKLAYILGILVSEGFIRKYTLEFSNTSRSIINEFLRCWKTVFPDANFDLRILTSKEDNRSKKNVCVFNCNSGHIVECLSKLGLHPGDSYDRIIPEIIFKSSKEEVGAFLKGLFDGDGSVSLKNNCIFYDSCNDQLLNQIQLLLLNYFAVVSYISSPKLFISGKSNIQNFEKYIGFISKSKKKRLTKITAYLPTSLYAVETHNDVIPDNVRESVNLTWKEAKISQKIYYSESGDIITMYNGNEINGKLFNIPSSRRKFRSYINEKLPKLKQYFPILHDKIQEIAERDYFYAKVDYVKPLRRKRWVYDLTVPSTHAFVANGFIAHNTESRLSEFACKIMMDPDYMAVAEMVLNFSEDKKMPLILPVKLPILLLIGSSSIAFGVSAFIPSFHINGLMKLVATALRGKPITPKLCLKYLQFNFTYGGVCVSEDQELLEFFKTGKGSVRFIPEYHIDDKKKQFVLTSVCPGLQSRNSIDRFLKDAADLPGVKSAFEATDKEGIKYIIQFGKTSEHVFNESCEKLETMVQKSERYDIGVTVRHIEESGSYRATFSKETIPSLIEKWVKWRIELEIKVVKHLLSIEDKKLKRQQLLLFAVLNREVIVKSLNSKDPKIYLMEYLNISEESASEILQLQLIRLHYLEAKSLKDKIKEIQSAMNELKKGLKLPQQRVLADLKTIHGAYKGKM